MVFEFLSLLGVHPGLGVHPAPLQSATATELRQPHLSSLLNQSKFQARPIRAEATLIARQSLWKVFQPPEGGFEVLMPGQPVPLGASFEVEGIPLQLKQYVTSQQNETVIYMVGWTDLPSEQLSQVSPQDSLDSVRDGFRDRLQGQLAHEFQVQLAGSPGRHFKLRAVVDNRPYSVTQRIYLKGNRIYQLTAMVPRRIEFNLTQSVSGFLKSFTFVPLK